ncbi:Receptor-like protein kinase HERK 1 [Linum grandiflorum]
MNWESDAPSKYLRVEDVASSTVSTTQVPSTSLQSVPYRTARLSRSQFTYAFPVNPGQKFIRLHFVPATYTPDFNSSAAYFSLKVGPFTLLNNFSAELHALALSRGPHGSFYMEFCLNVEPYQHLLNLTFAPSPGAYAFINGIEVVSMPTNLYYTNADDPEGPLSIGTNQRVENSTALQLMYRVNVGGSEIVPNGDTGMYRRWEPDTARGMSNDTSINLSYNLTWMFQVDPLFTYFVRLHFCEFQPEITAQANRAFLVNIMNQTASGYVDVIEKAGGNGIPVFKDYLARMVGAENKILFIALSPYNEASAYSGAILNGVEIYKLSSSDNLAGRFPKFSYIESKSGTSKYSSSTLPSDLCRRFSLTEIKSATRDFNEAFIIGVGGFGNVYKGLINDGSAGTMVSVAIKRLNPGSQQGANEFKTEIEMLSQLRHIHLVSLIGYCYDDGEMILVYDYMSNGTLQDHLYNTDNPPIPWKQRLEICICAARGLHYLHSGANNSIIHRDVKTTNILLDEKWVAKVSDFGLSKIGPGAEDAHVSTVVKGSVGYLDPEYYRLQRLTEKSDVYSFGVVLWEVLSARPSINRTGNNNKAVSLAEQARQSCRSGRVKEMVDPHLDGEIGEDCLHKFAEVAKSCLKEKGVDRPSMGDVVWGLEFAMELQENGREGEGVKLLLEKRVENEFPMMNGGGSNMFSINSEMVFGSQMKGIITSTNTDRSWTNTTTTSAEQSFLGQYGSESSLLESKPVFSEIQDPRAR